MSYIEDITPLVADHIDTLRKQNYNYTKLVAVRNLLQTLNCTELSFIFLFWGEGGLFLVLSNCLTEESMMIKVLSHIKLIAHILIKSTYQSKLNLQS